MKTHTNHQIINDTKGNPLFAIIPYNEYLDFIRYNKDEEIIIPNTVVEYMIIQGYSPIKAWRNYKKLSQSEVANKIGISQAAFSQMEQVNANLRKDTIQKIAAALEIKFEHLYDI